MNVVITCYWSTSQRNPRADSAVEGVSSAFLRSLLRPDLLSHPHPPVFLFVSGDQERKGANFYLFYYPRSFIFFLLISLFAAS
jgi:hypothetical protein